MMTYEDFENAIAECVKDPDKLPMMVEALTAGYKEQVDTNEAYKTKMAELETKNNALRDSNADLVLKVLHQGKEEAPEITREQRVAELTKKFKNE